MKGVRIFLTGVGGQGTLTATKLLANIAMDNGISVTAGEIHGMAQRGGVVESTVLLGDFLSPKIDYGQADILLGFEILETLRALPYLAKDGKVLSSSQYIRPIGVAMGRETLPPPEELKAEILKRCPETRFVACQELAEQVRFAKAANIILLAALFSMPEFILSLEALEKGIKKYLKPKLVEMNLHAVSLVKNGK